MVTVWIKKGCRHLDGEKLNAGQVGWGHKREYVDKAQAKRISRRIQAERARLSRQTAMLRPVDVQRETGLHSPRILHLERQGVIQSEGTGRSKRFPPDTIAKIRQHAVPWKPSSGFLSAKQLASRIGISTAKKWENWWLLGTLRKLRERARSDLSAPRGKWRPFFYEGKKTVELLTDALAHDRSRPNKRTRGGQRLPYVPRLCELADAYSGKPRKNGKRWFGC